MKRLMMIFAATAAFAVTGAGAVSAHPDEQPGYHQDEEQYGSVDSYVNFQQEYAHIMQGIQHGLGDGSYSRYQASQYYRELRNIQRQAYYADQHGDYDGGQIQARLERLHNRMHRDHNRGHERQDRNGYGNYRNSDSYGRDRYDPR